MYRALTDVEHVVPRADIRGTTRLGTTGEIAQLGGIDTSLDDVVQQSRKRSDGEGNDEQADVSVLDHQLIEVVESTLIYISEYKTERSECYQ